MSPSVVLTSYFELYWPSTTCSSALPVPALCDEFILYSKSFKTIHMPTLQAKKHLNAETQKTSIWILALIVLLQLLVQGLMYHYISSDMYFRVITRCNAMVLIISDIPNFFISAIIEYSFKRGEQIICIHIVKRQNLCHVDQGKFILKINSKVSIKKPCPIGCTHWSGN